MSVLDKNTLYHVSICGCHCKSMSKIFKKIVVTLLQLLQFCLFWCPCWRMHCGFVSLASTPFPVVCMNYQITCLVPSRSHQGSALFQKMLIQIFIVWNLCCSWVWWNTEILHVAWSKEKETFWKCCGMPGFVTTAGVLKGSGQSSVAFSL